MSIDNNFDLKACKQLRELVAYSGFTQKEIIELAIDTLYAQEPWPIDINMTLIKQVRNGLAIKMGWLLEDWCKHREYSLSFTKVALDRVEKGESLERRKGNELLIQLEKDSGVELTL